MDQRPGLAHEQDRRGFRWRGHVGIAVLVTAGTVILFSAPWNPEGSWPDAVGELLGWPLFVAGVVMRLWATLYVGGRKGRTVVDEGPYSVTRNPLYLGSFFLGCSAAFFLESATFLVAMLIMALFYTRLTVKIEERSLLAQLGSPYENYCKEVPRYWPDWRRFRSAPLIEVDLHALRREAQSALGYCWIPMLGEALMLIRGIPGWPHWFRVP